MDADLNITVIGNEYKFNGLGLDVRGKSLSDLEKAVEKALKGKPDDIASAMQVIASCRTEIAQTNDGYIFNGLGCKFVTEKNLACLERSVERALAGQSDKIAIAKKAIADYKAIL